MHMRKCNLNLSTNIKSFCFFHIEVALKGSGLSLSKIKATFKRKNLIPLGAYSFHLN